jgi:hypothetical protein
MSDHAKHSPSGLAYKELCPNYMPDDSPTLHPVTQEGSLLHAKVENETTEGLDPRQKALVEDCLAFTEKVTAGAPEVYREIRLNIGQQDDGTFLTFGTLDHLAVGGDTAVAVDYKFGYHGIDPLPENLQGVCYALGIFEKFPAVEKLHFHFYLPRRGERTSHTFTRGDVDNMRMRISTVIARSEAEDTEYNPMPRACQYCAAKAACPALSSKALVLANKYASTQCDLDIDALENVHSSEITNPMQMAKALEIASVIEDWAKSVKHHARSLAIEQGVEIPGYRIVETRGRASVGNAQEIFNVLSDRIDPDEYIEACKVDVSKLQKILAKKAERGTKGLVQEKLLEELEDAELYTSGGTQHQLRKQTKKTE